jgi:hypothetical protein
MDRAIRMSLAMKLTPTNVFVSAITISIGYGIWRYLRPSPFANIPGPPSPSFLTGHSRPLQVDKDAVKFCMNITEEYGGVVKLKSALGVGDLLVRFTKQPSIITKLVKLQKDILYISDPLALHHILKHVETWNKPKYVDR